MYVFISESANSYSTSIVICVHFLIYKHINIKHNRVIMRISLTIIKFIFSFVPFLPETVASILNRLARIVQE